MRQSGDAHRAHQADPGLATPGHAALRWLHPARRTYGARPSPGTLLRRPDAWARDDAERDGVALVFTAEQEAIETAFDADKLEKVVSNLLSNAFKFTPEGGRITVTVARAGDDVVFGVEDTGPGIAPEDLPRVFDRFWQARRHGSHGIGLGLAIARGLVEAHGGRVEVESEVGRGTCLTITLPLAPAGQVPEWLSQAAPYRPFLSLRAITRDCARAVHRIGTPPRPLSRICHYESCQSPAVFSAGADQSLPVSNLDD